MHHDKPLKQSLAIAYAMKRKAQHKSHGGPMCAHGGPIKCVAGCYAKGEEVGVNKTTGVRGRSEAGSKLTPAFSVFGKEHDVENAKKEHKKTLSELKSMPKPNLMAEGGSVGSYTKREDNEKGVHQVLTSKGESKVGHFAQSAHESEDPDDKKDDLESAKREHRKVLFSMRGMKKPKLYAGGGDADSGPAIDPEKVKQFQKGFNAGDVSISDAISNAKKALGMAGGGMMKSKRKRAMDAFHGKKMAEGGMLTDDGYQSHGKPEIDGDLMPAAHLKLEKKDEFVSHPDSHDSSVGHDVMNQEGDEDEGAGDMDCIHPMVRKIMMGRMKGYSEGGKVANEESGESTDEPTMAKASGNEFDDLALRDDLEFDSTGANEGDELDDAQENKDRSDIIARILKSRAKKDRMPRPA